MRISLDATYSIDPHPSGIAVYSTQLLTGLASLHPQDRFTFCYRPKQFPQAPAPLFPNVRRSLLLPMLPTFNADLFHALNQRVDRRLSKRVITTFHDLFVMTGNYSTAEFRKRFASQARQAAANSDWIVTVSEFTAGQVAGLLNVPRDRIRVILHGVHPPPDTPPTPRRKNILFVGALQERKNISRLVQAFERLPSDWDLTLAGSLSGYQSPQIAARIAASSARSRIKTTGYVTAPELEDLYRKASIFAFPSLDEGFGIPILEAMARGVPVVTSNRSALPEVAGDAALLVDPTSADQIESALLSLIRNAGLREKLVLRGLARVSQFTWKKAVDETYALYQEALT